MSNDFNLVEELCTVAGKLKRVGRYSESKQAYLLALRFAEGDNIFNIFYNLAKVLQASGDIETAQRSYLTAFYSFANPSWFIEIPRHIGFCIMAEQGSDARWREAFNPSVCPEQQIQGMVAQHRKVISGDGGQVESSQYSLFEIFTREYHYRLEKQLMSSELPAELRAFLDFYLEPVRSPHLLWDLNLVLAGLVGLMHSTENQQYRDYPKLGLAKRGLHLFDSEPSFVDTESQLELFKRIVAEEKSPRQRKSESIVRWGIEVLRIFAGVQDTNGGNGYEVSGDQIIAHVWPAVSSSRKKLVVFGLRGFTEFDCFQWDDEDFCFAVERNSDELPSHVRRVSDTYVRPISSWKSRSESVFHVVEFTSPPIVIFAELKR